ncbi:MAG TPA: rhodanese-like domain-containing protein [Gaiellaceae bacterium]|nr:rhodanese-like domain-containing protein [Gaiellaceae bacterium]
MDVTADELAQRLEDPRLVVLDVRTPQEYAGAAGYPCDPRHGHVPGARNLEVNELLELDDAALRDRVGDPADVEVVAYCHSGSRSAMAVVRLRAAGYDARNYAGSWHEWSADPARPLEA